MVLRTHLQNVFPTRNRVGVLMRYCAIRVDAFKMLRFALTADLAYSGLGHALTSIRTEYVLTRTSPSRVCAQNRKAGLPRRKPNSPVGTWVFVQLCPRERTPDSRLCLMAVPLLAVDWFLGDASHHGFANPSCVFCFIPCLTLHGVALRTREGRSLRATAQR